MPVLSTRTEYSIGVRRPPHTLPELVQTAPSKIEQIRTRPNSNERPLTALVRRHSHNRRTIPSEIDENRTKSNKTEQTNLKKPEKAESPKRTIFNLLLNFVPLPTPEKKFPENLKPLARSRLAEHAIPLRG